MSTDNHRRASLSPSSSSSLSYSSSHASILNATRPRDAPPPVNNPHTGSLHGNQINRSKSEFLARGYRGIYVPGTTICDYNHFFNFDVLYDGFKGAQWPNGGAMEQCLQGWDLVFVRFVCLSLRDTQTTQFISLLVCFLTDKCWFVTQLKGKTQASKHGCKRKI